jgi:ABC-type branched-subunit amino acid transport system substrate-binding protein
MGRKPGESPLGTRRRCWSLCLLAAAFAGLAIVAVACGGGEKKAPDALAALAYPQSARVFLREAVEAGKVKTFLFCDGTKSADMFKDLGWSTFDGMKGTAPSSLDVAAGKTFEAAYTAEYGSTPPLPFMREIYDAVYLVALAAEKAGSTDSTAIRDALRDVANPPGETVGPGTDGYEAALALIADGKDINYEGASGPVDLDKNGDVLIGAIETWHVDAAKQDLVTDAVYRVDLNTGEVTPVTQAAEGTPATTPSPAETASAQTPPAQTPPARPTTATPLKLGLLLAYTGDLSDFGPAHENAARLAVKEINAAGGVLGAPIEVATGDTATDPSVGVSEATRLINVEHVQVILGALASGVTLPVAESVTGPDHILQISEASTSPALTAAKDNDFLFRTTISDAAQGVVLAKLATDLGLKSVCTMYINNAYGQGLSQIFSENFEKAGGTVTAQVPHESEQATYASELAKCTGGD